MVYMILYDEKRLGLQICGSKILKKKTNGVGKRLAISSCVFANFSFGLIVNFVLKLSPGAQLHP
jgi:hypothetical protein